MDSDATVMLGSGDSAKATVPSRTSRTESTAVFVGRASFQMVPAHQKYRRTQDEVTPGVELRPNEPEAIENARQEVVEALHAEARALRAESELRVAAAAMVASTAGSTPAPGPTVIVSSESMQTEKNAAVEVSPQRPGAVLHVRPQVDVTEPIDARARPRSAPRARRGGVSPRTIVLALFAGASITLSAQAVMRRPSVTEPALRAAVIARPQLAAAPIPPAVTGAPAAPPVPTVVASTATAPQHQLPAEPSPPASAPRRRLRAQPPVTTVHQAGAPRIRHQASTAWVDPFVDPAPAKTSESTKTAKTIKTTEAWVDPFVD